MPTKYTLTVYSASDNPLIFADLDRSQLSRLNWVYNPQFEANYWVTGISIERDVNNGDRR
jgi:hypothetical protein